MNGLNSTIRRDKTGEYVPGIGNEEETKKRTLVHLISFPAAVDANPKGSPPRIDVPSQRMP